MDQYNNTNNNVPVPFDTNYVAWAPLNKTIGINNVQTIEINLVERTFILD